MSAEAEALDVTRYTEQYELLRAQIVATTRDMARGYETGAPRGIGLALLLREGIPGWLKAVEAVIRASLVPRAAERCSGEAQPGPEGAASGVAVLMTLPSTQRRDLTTLLASLVLSTRRLAGLPPSEGYRPCP